MRYDQPIGTLIDRNAEQVWAGGWFDASGFGAASVNYKRITGSWHTGADLNLPGLADSGKGVYAAADGEVVWAAAASGWQGIMVCLKHTDGMWTRYAHLKDPVVVALGARVVRGTLLGYIGDYNHDGAPSDHLHFDISKLDMGKFPANWPKDNLTILEANYVDPRAWINSHRKDDIMDNTLWTPIDAKAGSRVRLSQDMTSTANIVGVIPGGAIVSGTLTADQKWIQIQITPVQIKSGDVVLQPSVITSFTAFVASAVMKIAERPPPIPPPSETAPANKLLGLHVIAHHQYAAEAYLYGARSFLWMEGHTGASEFKAAHPDAMIIYRKNLPRGVRFNATDLINAVDGMSDPNLLYIGENESDQSNVSDMAQLEDRLRRDMQVALMRPGQFVSGEFSMGTPQLEKPEVQRLFRDIVAPVYNAGKVYIGFHTYEPDKKWLKVDGSLWQSQADGTPYAALNGQVCDPIWFTTRWKFLFTHCGFDPRVRKIIGGETGADKGGVGGFPALQTSDAEFELWCRGYLYLQRLPVVITSGNFVGEWPSPFVASTIFQRSDFPDWLGYRIPTQWLPILQKLYNEPTPVVPRSYAVIMTTPLGPITPAPKPLASAPKSLIP